MFVAVPSVIKHGDVFEMWYSGVKWATQFDSVRIGYAVSLNGTDWIKYPDNPVLYAANGDSSGFWAVDVVWDSLNNQYKMWYENKYIAGAQAIYHAVSPRNVLHSDFCNATVSNDTAITQGDTIQLFATGGTFYQWYPSDGLNNPNIANPQSSPPFSGEYTVLIVSDSCITTKKVAIDVLPVSTIENQILPISLNIFPNPVTNFLTIQLLNCDDSKIKNAEITIYDLVGKKVFKCPLTNSILEIHPELQNGIYFLKIETDNLLLTKKIIKQ